MNPELASAIPIAVVTAVFTAGAAWGAVKASLNGTKQDVKDTKTAVTSLQEDMTAVKTDVAYLKGRESVKAPQL